MKRALLLVVVLLMAVCACAEEQFSDVTIKVMKEENGKPVRNAAVILHSVDGKGKQLKGGVNLKTDSEGKAGFNSVSYGKLRIQVIAHGLQTYGEDFSIDQPQQEILIKLKPPQQQFTIYGDKPGDKPKEEPKKP